MADRSLQFNLNFDLKQGNDTVNLRVVDKFSYDMENYLIENITFVIANRQQKILEQSIHNDLSLIVQQQLREMGRKIDQFVVGIPNNAATTLTRNNRYGGRSAIRSMTGPPGSLSLTGVRSQAFRGVNMGPFTLVSGTGPWPSRNPNYLARKKRKVGHTKWFQTTGQLRKQLREPSTYTNAYGPVRVSFKKNQLVDAKAGDVVTRMSSGVAGKADRRIVIGELKVSVLGRITEDMLADPGGRQPSPWMTGLFGSLDDDLEKKLLNRQDAYRPFLEVFLSFYLTRSIPNAIFRRLEEKMKVGAGGSAAAKRYTNSNLVTLQQKLTTR